MNVVLFNVNFFILKSCKINMKKLTICFEIMSKFKLNVQFNSSSLINCFVQFE